MPSSSLPRISDAAMSAAAAAMCDRHAEQFGWPAWDERDPSERADYVEDVELAIGGLVERASFDDLTALARLILDEHYPADIFVGGGPNTDPGVQLVVALQACDEARAAAAPTDTTEENTDG